MLTSDHDFAGIGTVYTDGKKSLYMYYVTCSAFFSSLAFILAPILLTL